MGGFENKKIVLIVQCRLSSTRLPGKALLSLGGKPTLEWNLCAMKKVLVDDYYLATDQDSYADLKPVADRCGFKIFAGDRDDVLDRFCKVIELSKTDLVVRATADNPFLFYEAANDLVDLWKKKSVTEKIDYMTFSGLPHGCGVEMFDAHSLLSAKEKTNLPYDHEHVGPALYNHPENFVSVFQDAPEKYNHPKLRTTIDTSVDFIRAQKIVDYLSEKKIVPPYTTQETLSAFEKSSIKNPVLLVPSVEKGHGTGHLFRCLNLAVENGWDIYIPKSATLPQLEKLLSDAKNNGLKDYQIVDELLWLDQYSLIVTDMFKMPSQLSDKLMGKTPVCALDEGCEKSDWVEYMLDIIPSVGLKRKANLVDWNFIPLPKNRKIANPKKFENAIVVLGGEDPKSLSVPSAKALLENKIKVTLVSSDPEETKKYFDDLSNLEIVPPIKNLREKLFEYDLLVTHYGFTAFEGRAAGCGVLLLGTSSLHEKLSHEYGFKCLSPKEINSRRIKIVLMNPENLLFKKDDSKEKSLGNFLTDLSKGLPLPCPICGGEHDCENRLVARTPERTFRRCKRCGMVYQSWTVQSVQTEYKREYFYEDYEKQYGKTYEEDFASIKSQGKRRIENVEKVFKKKGSVLDIGCALGPFLDAAKDCGWKVYGTDICQDAVDYVNQKLNLPAVCGPFPDVDLKKHFGVDGFDAVTMWFVIEHFQNLDDILKAVSSLVKKDGIFAFSTPSGEGVSGKYNTQSFFEQSPSDHYSIWEPSKVDSILSKYGFKLCKIVPTGIHPERFPIVKKNGWTKENFQFKILEKISRAKNLGDTFEVYCKKVK